MAARCVAFVNVLAVVPVVVAIGTMVFVAVFVVGGFPTVSVSD